jgi:excisionase family DNA binding protein
MTPAPTGFVWMNTKEAAGRLGVTTRTLYQFINRGELTAYRFGRVIRLKDSEVDEFIESCKIPPGTLNETAVDIDGDINLTDGSASVHLVGTDGSTAASVTDLNAR